MKQTNNILKTNMKEDALKTILTLLRQVDYKDLFLISSKLNEHIYTRGVEDYINHKEMYEGLKNSTNIEIREMLKSNNQ